jgi:hypothetical protein
MDPGGIRNQPSPWWLAMGGGGGTLTYLFYRFWGTDAFWIVLVGSLAVGFAVAGYAWILKRGEKRKARGFEEGVGNQVGKAPTRISDTTQRARLDDLRKRFLDGVRKLREATGKDLYELPWYLLVGEPGSGKSEAVRPRHSGLPCPPGMQDEFQGAGGTINMDWWFTNEAVILDTAGRLMFEELPPGMVSEWQEFLRLLRSNRPNCPINGALLVIPADSLIRDTTDQVNVKAARIAERLAMIQKLLGVRFPLYVVITKSDLINGYREFFDNIADPEGQRQILGWSNPASLDEAFNSQDIGRHLETLAARLRRRRLGLLLDPVNTENPSARRTDQVDALYSFPESLMRLAPRLQLYLEKLFFGGPFAAKPLFLRGVYFTSAMREGSALDDELAEVLGVPVESLHDGRVWERERSYFLRDLFVNKVFKEKGLVTRAARAGGQYRRRKAAVVGAGLAAVALLAALTLYFFAQFDKSLGERHSYYHAAANDRHWYEGYWHPVVRLEEGLNPSPVLVEGAKLRPARFHRKLVDINSEKVDPPWIFFLSATLSDDLNDRCREAERILFERGVLYPLVDAARKRMANPKRPPWREARSDRKPDPPLPQGTPTPDKANLATETLIQLMRLEEHPGELPAPEALDHLCEYVLDGASGEGKTAGEGGEQVKQGYPDYIKEDDAGQSDRKAIAEAFLWIYPPDNYRDKPWLAKGLATDPAAGAIRQGATGFIKYWSPERLQGSGRMADLSALAVALGQFDTAEERLLKVFEPFPRDALKQGAVHAKALAAWNEAHKELLAKREAVDKGVGILGADALLVAYGKAYEDSLNPAREAYRRLLGPDFPGDPGPKPNPAGRAAEPSKAAEAPARAARAAPAPAAKPGTAETIASAKEDPKKACASAKQDLKMAWESLADCFKSQGPQEARLREFDSRFLDRILVGDPSSRLYYHRCKMYRIASGAFQQLPDQAEVGAQARAVAEFANNGLTAIRALDRAAGERWRVPEACKVSQEEVRLLAGGRLFAAFDAGLKQVLPKDLKELNERIKALAAGDPVRNFPEIPLVVLPEPQPRPEYSPAGAAAYFVKWQTLGECLEKEQQEYPDRGELLARHAAARDAHLKYIKEYLHYWACTVPEPYCGTVGADWATWREKLPPVSAAVFVKQEDLCRAMADALDKMLPVVPKEMKGEWEGARRALEEQRRHLGNRVYLNDRDEAISNWRALGPDAAKARLKILEAQPRAFVKGYVPVPIDAAVESGDAPALPFVEFVDGYWLHLAMESLRLVGRDWKVGFDQQIETFLKQYGRFPLALPVDQGPWLTPAQVEEARKTILAFGQQEWSKETLGGGAKTDRPKVDALLELLRRFPVASKEQEKSLEQLRKMQRVLEALPQEGQAATCDVCWPGLRDQVSNAQKVGKDFVGSYYRFVRVGEQEISTEADTEKVLLEKVQSVGDPGPRAFVFRPLKASTEGEGMQVFFEAPWAILKMALLGESEDGKTWTSTFVTNQTPGLVFTVRIKFAGALPVKRDWPGYHRP